MIKGQEITFTDLNSPGDIKNLNDSINYILSAIETSFGLNGGMFRYIFSKKVECDAGGTCTVNFDREFVGGAAVFASSNDGAGVIVLSSAGDTQMTKKCIVKFVSEQKDGVINLIAAGSVKL